jgi:hypothetical protein
VGNPIIHLPVRNGLDHSFMMISGMVFGVLFVYHIMHTYSFYNVLYIRIYIYMYVDRERQIGIDRNK